MGEFSYKIEISMHVARDKDGSLFLYGLEPEKDEKTGMYNSSGYVSKIDNVLFPNVTWENSPVNLDKFINLDDACEWLVHNASKYSVGNILAADFYEAMIEKRG